MILFFNEQNFFKFSALKKIYVYIYKSQKYDLTSRVRKKKGIFTMSHCSTSIWNAR